MTIPEVDDYDLQILNILRNNARISYSDLAAQIGISRVAVKRHIDELEKKGIIQGYATKIVSQNTPESIMFFLDIEAVPELYQKVVDELATKQIISKVYSTSGECRLHAIGTAPNRSTLEHFVNHIYRSAKGIKKLVCHTVLSTIKDVDRGIDYE